MYINMLFGFRLEETREEFEDFQVSSREFEAELETQVEQLEKKSKTLGQENSRLQHEVESLRVRNLFKYNIVSFFI
jgi:septal ring factor EnvC (AmiA/AmiB activator)